MRVLVTGATGLVGRAIVASARRAGHQVDALVRPASAGTFADLHDPDLSEVQADLRGGGELEGIVDAVDAVVHAAALKAGDLATQFAATVRGTERLLDAMGRRRGRRLVAVSSMSVYALERVPEHSLVTAGLTPVEVDGPHRDAYARAKLFQERLTSAAHASGVADVVTLRPGIVIGPGEHPWHPLLGTWAGGRFVVVGRHSRPPLAYVDNTADAITAALTADCSGAVLDVVDDDLPTNAAYVDAVLRRTRLARPAFVPWAAARTVATAAGGVATRVLGQDARLPGLLVPARLHARFKPLRYTNAAAREALGWRPRHDLDAALDHIVGATPSLRTAA